MGVTLYDETLIDERGGGDDIWESQAQPDPPRVLFLATSAGSGGIERHSAGLAAHLWAQGVPVTYLCRLGTFLESACAAQNIPARPFQVRNSGDPSAVIHLARLIRENRAEILHVHSRRDFVPAALAVALLGSSAPRLVLHSHLDKPLGSPPRLSGTLFRRTASAVIAVSEAVRQTLIQAHGLPPELVCVVPNCLDAARFAVPSDPRAKAWRDDQRRRWGIPPDAFVIGMVGRLPDKGQAALLALAPRLLEKYPRLRLVFVGPDGSEAERLGLETTAASFGLTDKIVFAGRSEEMPAAMAALDILAHFPQSEAFGLVLLEAAASGLPTVTSRVGGCGEVVVDSVTGLLVPPGDAEARLGALSSLLEGERGAAKRAALGAAGRERVLSCFAPELETAAVQQLYKHLLHKNHADA